MSAPAPEFWRGKRVLLTGHTGFKGAWLALWLHELGASVVGLAGEPPSDPSLYALAGVRDLLAGEAHVDVRDEAAVLAAVEAAEPEIVIHMAAQAIVRRSFVAPAESFAVNAVGTAHVLEGVRALPSGTVRAAVVVTSDKCYRSRSGGAPYVEDDPLGGGDPYSASKAAQEHVAWSMAPLLEGCAVATARAGNVIGGGDWAADRLVPDMMRAAVAGEPVIVRSPGATRPWQHVLNPLSGYLVLAERLWSDPGAAAGGWNFGPALDDAKPVSWIVERVRELWPGSLEIQTGNDAAGEATWLALDSTKAREQLGWEPRWDLDAGLTATVEWYAEQARGADVREVTRTQIAAFA